MCARHDNLWCDAMMWSEKLSAYSVCLPLSLSLSRSLSLCLPAAATWWCTHSFKGRVKCVCQQRRWINVNVNAYAKLHIWERGERERVSEGGGRMVGNMGVAAVLTCCSFDCSFIMPMPGAGSLKELCHKLTLAKMSFVCIWQTRCLISHVACSVLPAACCMCCCCQLLLGYSVACLLSLTIFI